jgi:hypothetical protein
MITGSLVDRSLKKNILPVLPSELGISERYKVSPILDILNPELLILYPEEFLIWKVLPKQIS